MALTVYEQILEPECLKFESQLCNLLAVSPWTSYSSFPCFSFFNGKIGGIMAPQFHRFVVRIKSQFILSSWKKADKGKLY